MKYFEIFKKNIKILILVTLISTFITGFIVFFLLKPIYRGSCSIIPPSIYYYSKDIGYKKENLYSIDDLKNLIEEDSFLISLSKETSIPTDEIKKNLLVRIPKQTQYVIVIYENNNKERIMNLLNNIIKLLKDKDQKFDSYFTEINSNLSLQIKEKENIERDINDIKEEIENFQKNIKNKYENYIEYSILLSSYTSLKEKLNEIMLNIQNIQLCKSLSSDFTFFNNPSVLDKPVKPKKLFDIFYAMIFSFLITYLILIFYNEIFIKNK